MIATDASRFLENLSTDASLRATLRSAAVENYDGIADFALTRGYVFTGQDLKTALQTFPSDPYVDQLRERLKVSKAVNAR